MITLDIPPHEQMVIERACSMSGVSLEEFYRSSAYENALKIANDDSNSETFDPVFDYDLKRMKKMVEEQEFEKVPANVRTAKDIQQWLET